MIKGLMIANCEELPNAEDSGSEASNAPRSRLQPDSTSRGDQVKRQKAKERTTIKRRRVKKIKPYEYKELPSGNWTRVLHLYAAGSENDPLLGWLQIGDLRKPPARKSSFDPESSKPSDPEEENRLPKFDALSWCWGDPSSKKEPLSLQDKDGRQQYNLDIPPNLAKALRALRYSNKRRTLWVDAICVDMNNKNERAHQVAQMNWVYTRAGSVCIWLDDDPQVGAKYGYKTQEVFDFIEKDLLDVSNFDEVISTGANARLVAAVAQLMTRPWFSRRWVIQEIALTRKATIHSGSASMKWEKFAHAVSMFVKAETSNHQLSKLVSQEKVLNNKQGVFWDVQRMGAVSLVEITTSNFFHSQKGLPEPKATLESLMAMLPMCEASKGRDVIYALLAIAKDTTPEAEGSRSGRLDFNSLYQFVSKFPTREEQIQKMKVAQRVAAMLAAGLRSKTYTVSYTQKSIDVYRGFVEFCIFQSRSLDVLCRPWAQKPGPTEDAPQPAEDEPETMSEHSDSSSDTDDSESEDDNQYQMAPQDFITDMQGEFDGLPVFGSPPQVSTNYEDGDAAGTEADDPVFHPAPTHFRPRRGRQTLQPQAQGDMPSWIADRKNLAFTLSSDEVNRMERKNGDPLVGLPDKKPYRASGARQVRMGQIKFLRRSDYDQSLFVEGFVLGKVSDTVPPGSLGNIPEGWFTFTDWDPESNRPPPSELYRTLIADRGPDGAKSPLTYMPAYYEIMKNTDKALDIKEKINEGKSVITEFLERVRQVTFNRRLVKVATQVRTRNGVKDKQTLGIAPGGTERGDLVCILYGCSVPVILRKQEPKTPEQKEEDAIAQTAELPSAMRKAVMTIERYWKFWQDMKAAVLCTKYEWPIYEDKREKWRGDIRAQFSKYWLDKVEADWAAKQAGRLEEARVVALNAETDPAQTNIWRSGTDRVGRPNGVQHQTSHVPAAKALESGFPKEMKQEDRDAAKWDAMRTEWKEWLDAYRRYGTEYPGRNTNIEDQEIENTTNTPDVYYKLIGESYVDQMMDGEALIHKGDEEIEDQVFELR